MLLPVRKAIVAEDLWISITYISHKSCRASTGSRGQDFRTDVDTEGVAMETSVRQAFRSSATVEDTQNPTKVGFSCR